MARNGVKTGGRKAGTPNKRTETLKELIEAEFKGFNPIVELIKMYKKESLEDNLKVAILKDIANYIYPKRKAIEDDIAEQNPINLIIDREYL